MVSYQLKEASVADAIATPPTTGRRDKTTHIEGNCQNGLGQLKLSNMSIQKQIIK